MTEALRSRSVLGPVVCVLLAVSAQLPSAPYAAALVQDSHRHRHHQHQQPQEHHQHRHHAERLPDRPSPTPSLPTGLAGSRAGEGREHPGRLADASDLGSPAPSATPAPTAAQDQAQDQAQDETQEEAQIPGPYLPPVAEQPQSSPAPRLTPSQPLVTAAPRRTMRVLPFGLGLALVGLGMAVIGLGLRRR